MDSLFLWELGTPKVYLIWLLVLAAQIVVAEINRRWNWTIFAVWTVGGIALMPYAWIHGTPMVGWFPFGKYAIMILTATMTGTVLVYAKRNPVKAHKYAIWLGVALWIGLAVNIMEANIRDLTIWANADTYYACGADWQCLKQVNDSHTIDMIAGLPEARGVTADLHSQQWYQEVAANLDARHVGIDPETGFRTIGGYWNLLSAAAGLLNIITITGLGKIIVTSPGKRSVRGLIWVDMVWPWVIAYDLWNHAFLYNSLADYTWYCTLALLLACTIPAFTWAKGQWIWFRCFTLVFWISMNTLLPEVLVPPSDISTSRPWTRAPTSPARRSRSRPTSRCSRTGSTRSSRLGATRSRASCTASWPSSAPSCASTAMTGTSTSSSTVSPRRPRSSASSLTRPRRPPTGTARGCRGGGARIGVIPLRETRVRARRCRSRSHYHEASPGVFGEASVRVG